MALEISEIGIHVRVPDGQPAPAPAAGRKTADGPCDDLEHARVVDDCVRRVLQILAARAER